MPKPHCPACKTETKPHSKITGLKGQRVLLVYCSECGCTLGAVNYTQEDKGDSLGGGREDVSSD